LEKNLRESSKRNSILRIFLKEEGHITAEGLYKKVNKEDSSIGIATVYRTLKLFHEAGLARMSRFEKGEAYYEHNYLHTHHDHLICLKCGQISEFKNPDIEETQEKIARKHKFKITSHRLELYGTCSKCSSK
jgi:Fur family ferric uptake transcriptional regulator